MHRRSLVLALALGALALPSSAAAAEECAGADTTISAATLASARAAVLCIVNAERSARGLGSLTQDDELQAAAQGHTLDMVAGGFFDHVDLLGQDPGDRITAAGYAWSTYGENIAAGYPTPREVMLGWMKSTGHCHNVLNPGFTELGVGVSPLAATLPGMVGTWTQNFGRPQGVAAPGHDEAPSQGCPYQALAGLDAAGTTTGPGAPDSDTPDSDPPASDEPSTPASGATPVLTLRLKRSGRRLAIRGVSLAPRVRLRVTWHQRVLWRGTVAVADGHYALRLTGVPRGGRVRVRVRGGGLRVTRSIS